jgi:predicted flap endonuclease-1-like 5' DNA nuclease
VNLIAAAPAWAETIGTVVLSSAGASILYWISKRRGMDNPEAFKVEKAAITLGVAFALSLVLTVAGQATGIEALLPHLSVAVGPVALYAQKVVNEYQRTGDIHIRNGTVDEAAQAVADVLGVTIDDVFDVTRSMDQTNTPNTPDKPPQRSQTGTPASHPAADTPKTPPADPAESEPVTAIQGIGSGRSSKLSGAGIETVADLASANVAQLSSESGIGYKRIRKWQALARER